MLLLRFTILVIFGVVTSQNHDVNSPNPFKGKIVERNVKARTPIPPDPRIDNEGIELFLTRLENLCVEKFEYLITDTNRRFESLENQSSKVIRDELGQIHYPLTRLESLLLEKLDNLTTEVGRMSQCCSTPATPVVPINKNLEVIVEDLSKDIPLVMDTTKNLLSDVEAIKPNVSSLINVTRSSNLVSKQIFNEGLQEPKVLQVAPATSGPLNNTLDPEYRSRYPKNCREVQKSGKTASGSYMIQPDQSPKPFEAVCEMKTRGGGWTVIQRRLDGSQDFYLGWDEYKNGFGDFLGEFWLGLENIHFLTGFEGNELLIELENFNTQKRNALYSHFSVGSEMEGYSLNTVGAYSGNAGDSFSLHVGRKFTTKDRDQDVSPNNCAQDVGGAWWYGYCTNSNLNGEYFHSGHVPEEVQPRAGIYWRKFFVYGNSLKYSRMLVRPKG